MNNSREDEDYLLVEEYQDLRNVAYGLESEKGIGVDIEADSMFHYKEKVCLVQVSAKNQNILIDPLSLQDLSPMQKIFKNPHVLKVFHGADYDIRSLYRDFGIEVDPLFDTQIASRFLGIRRYSLASVLKDMLGVDIDKKYQKRDWSKRPISKAMLDYAVWDSCRLLPLAKVLRDRLSAKGRLYWVEEENKILSMVRPAKARNESLFIAFKGAGRLDPRSLAILEAILKVRDKTASHRDVPPFKILGNRQILEIVKKKPANKAELKTIDVLSPRQFKALGGLVVKEIHKALRLPENMLPAYPKKHKRQANLNATRRARSLKEWRERRARELDIEAALVCTNQQIQSLALGYIREPKDLEHIDGIRNWQIKEFGREIYNVLRDAK